VEATAWLFGEAPSRIVVSLPPARWDEFAGLARAAGVPVSRLGTAGGERLRVGNLVDLPVRDLRDTWRGGLANALHAGVVGENGVAAKGADGANAAG
jgi:phosphoribosylformylglycinamidine synthase